MNAPYAIEDVIPHRGRMRLVDTILIVEADLAVTQATVRPDWPLMTPDGVHPIILIELAAQTAAVSSGRSHAPESDGEQRPAGGWLVGIKRADFSIDCIPVDACITIRSQNRIAVDQYREISAVASIGDRPIGEVHFQVLQAGKTQFSDLTPT